MDGQLGSPYPQNSRSNWEGAVIDLKLKRPVLGGSSTLSPTPPLCTPRWLQAIYQGGTGCEIIQVWVSVYLHRKNQAQSVY